MIRIKKKICKSCEKECYIFSHGLCKNCTPKKPLKNKRKITGEKQLFLSIWSERPHICSNCKKPLGYEPIVHNFSHIKSKGSNPGLRLDKDNIEILCQECHYLFEFSSKEKFNERKDLYGR